MQKLSKCRWIALIVLTLFCQFFFVCRSEAALPRVLSETTWRNPDQVSSQLTPREICPETSEDSNDQTSSGSGGSDFAVDAGCFDNTVSLLSGKSDSICQGFTDKFSTKLWLRLRSLLL